MLEPLIALTVLNCIFMFSSTVTTCALWWQYQGHRCCARKTACQSRADLKRSKSYILRTAKKSEKSDFSGNGDVNVVSNSNRNGSRERRNKNGQKKKSKKSLRYLAEYQKKSEGKMPLPLKTKKLDEKTKMSEASQTLNDTKSTVVMEFSTVQKVVQIVDDSDVNPMRPPFKDIVIQKDTMDRKRDCNVEQNFESNLAENS
ncbi:uncharacterized protein [Polyergus mexicanus]|uniref:uncharacterized protein n=1 Tax=Polyergus mexicanus TaxID=615972 RepID=UPI0038B4F4E1